MNEKTRDEDILSRINRRIDILLATDKSHTDSFIDYVKAREAILTRIALERIASLMLERRNDDKGYSSQDDEVPF